MISSDLLETETLCGRWYTYHLSCFCCNKRKPCCNSTSLATTHEFHHKRSSPTRFLFRVACRALYPDLRVSPGRNSLPHPPRLAANAFLSSHRRSDPEALSGPRHRRSIRAATPVIARGFLQHVLCIMRAIFRLPRTSKPPRAPLWLLAGGGARCFDRQGAVDGES